MSEQPIKLTLQAATELGGALDRLAQIGQTKIIEATTAAERRGLEQFVIATTSTHASELLACWFLVRGEYEPLCKAFNALLKRSLPAIQIQQPISTLPGQDEESKLKNAALASRLPDPLPQTPGPESAR